MLLPVAVVRTPHVATTLPAPRALKLACVAGASFWGKNGALRLARTEGMPTVGVGSHALFLRRRDGSRSGRAALPSNHQRLRRAR
jgi:hypothetical protein